MALQHLIDAQSHSIALARAAGNGNNAVEPMDGGVGRLKAHDSAEIISVFIDRFPPRQRGQHIGRTVPQSLASHQHAGAGLGLNTVTGGKVGGAVLPHDLPVRAWQNAALELWPLHLAADDIDDPALTVGRTPEMPDVGELGMNLEDRLAGDDV